MNWFDFGLGIVVLVLAAVNLDKPVYDRPWFHRHFGNVEPPWRDASTNRRVIRVFVSAMLAVIGALLVRFGLAGK